MTRTRSTIRRSRLLASATALALLLVACAGDDGDGGDDAEGDDTSDEESSADDDGDEDDDGGEDGDDDGESEEMLSLEVGYLHTVAVDSHMWLAEERGYFEDRGVEIEPTQFDSGISLGQALSGGSVDLAGMGAVISNFPAQGQGTAVLTNNIEADTAQIFVDAESGIESVADLEGEEVALTEGTTAHVLLQTALEAEGLHSDDVEVVNSEMPTAVNAFISGSVPALATWSPFNAQVQDQRDDVEIVATAEDYYPDAAILGGWVASNEAYDEKEEAIRRFTMAWLDANQDIMDDPEDAMNTVAEVAYGENLEVEDVQRMHGEARWNTNEEWAEMYQDGTVTGWLGQVNETFVSIGAFEEATPPEDFFDPDIFLDAYEEWSSE